MTIPSKLNGTFLAKPNESHDGKHGRVRNPSREPLEIALYHGDLSVQGAAGYSTDEKDEENLNGANPGDGTARDAEGGDVVGLEDAEGIEISPGIEDDEVAHEHLGPGFDTAIRRRWWS